MTRAARGPAVLDEAAGTYRRVRFGDTRERVVAVLGPPGDEPECGPISPLGDEFADIGGPPFLPAPSSDLSDLATLRYEGVSVLIGPRGVYAFLVSEADARTRRGVGIGDTLADARRAYGRVGCETFDNGEGVEYPYCRTTVGGVRLWFGEDPIRSVTVVDVRRARVASRR